MLSHPRAVVFDWDNTLVDSWEAIAEAINFTRCKFNLDVWSMDQIHVNCTRAARDSFPEWFGPDQWEEAYAVYYACFDKVRQRVGIQKKPGAEELIEYFRSQSIPLFVVSNKRGDYLREEASHLKWSNHFIALIGATDAQKDKPARDPVDMALSHAHITADTTVWFIGDSKADVDCARNSGCLPVFIGSPELGQQLGVDVVFSDCKQLKTLLIYGRF